MENPDYPARASRWRLTFDEVFVETQYEEGKGSKEDSGIHSAQEG